MARYGYAAQAIDDVSSRTVTSAGAAGDHWVLTKFSRVLALAFRQKLWGAKPAQPAVPFGDVIERVKQAQATCDEKRLTHGQPAEEVEGR